MNKIFTSEQTRVIDNKTITNEPVSSIDLMERAALSLFGELEKIFDLYKTTFIILAGTGNNGGDGLAIARMMYNLNVSIEVVFCKFTDSVSPDCQKNLDRLKDLFFENIKVISKADEVAFKKKDNVVILDCIFGSGLNRPVTGEFSKIINKINSSGNYIISIDLPSGLFGEDNTHNNGAVINANKTLTIQFPPVSSMFAENYTYYGDVEAVPIGLSEEAILSTETRFFAANINAAKSLLKKRKPFDHKGVYGHALIISGSYGKGGAAVLSSKSCMKSGVGLATAHIPSSLADILQISVPEVMLSIDNNEHVFSDKVELNNYTAIGIGPGIGVDENTEKAFVDLLRYNHLPMVIDADAINILSKLEDFERYLKSGTILTPHPKEFERLFGKFENSWQKIEFMSEFSKKTGVIIVLKGGITIISMHDGRLIFNTGGNPGMATGGSGDVLTGIIASLLAQKYEPSDAAILGVFIHSLAGDIAMEKCGLNSLTASDIIICLKDAFIMIE